MGFLGEGEEADEGEGHHGKAVGDADGIKVTNNVPSAASYLRGIGEEAVEAAAEEDKEACGDADEEIGDFEVLEAVSVLSEGVADEEEEDDHEVEDDLLL